MKSILILFTILLCAGVSHNKNINNPVSVESSEAPLLCDDFTFKNWLVCPNSLLILKSQSFDDDNKYDVDPFDRWFMTVREAKQI